MKIAKIKKVIVKRFLPILLCMTFLFSLFIFNASAFSINLEDYLYAFIGGSDDLSLYNTSQSDSNSYNFIFSNTDNSVLSPGVYQVKFGFIVNPDYSYPHSMNSSAFSLILNGTNYQYYQGGSTLSEFEIYRTTSSGVRNDAAIVGDPSWGDYLGVKFDDTVDKWNRYTFVVYVYVTPNSYSMLEKSIRIRLSFPNGISITADSSGVAESIRDQTSELTQGYEKPNQPNNDTINNFNSIENDLNNATNSGIQQATNIFSDFGTDFAPGTYLGQGMLATTNLIRQWLDIPQVNDIVYFSLAVGIFIFLLGIGAVFRNKSGKGKGK